MKNILIALDYNPTAQKVAEAGIKLAKKMAAQVTLVHVIADPTYYSTADYSPIMGFNGFNAALDVSNTTEELKTLAYDFLDKSKKHLDDISIKIIVAEGDSADAILKTAEEIHAGIIVMGSHSRRWLDKILMGNVTEKVLDNTTIPVFIIPTKKA